MSFAENPFLNPVAALFRDLSIQESIQPSAIALRPHAKCYLPETTCRNHTEGQSQRQNTVFLLKDIFDFSCVFFST